MPTNLKEPTQRQEMTLTKLAQVCSLSEEATHKVLLTVCKGVAHFVRQQNRQTTIDLKLPSNEVLHFTTDSVLMTERDRIVGLVQTINKLQPKSPLGHRGQRRYDLADALSA